MVAPNFFRYVAKKEGIKISEIKLGVKSSLSGLKKIDILRQTGAVVMGIKEKTRRFKVVVPFKRKIKKGETLLVMGTEEQLKDVEKRAKK
ncbi:MAG: hypothetical protein GY861_07065 [bacterium]|nr:hypothetical protein [bacterium]